MAHAPTQKNQQSPPPPPDAENQAIVDAAKTFKWTLIGAALFVLAAVFLILQTRMG